MRRTDLHQYAAATAWITPPEYSGQMIERRYLRAADGVLCATIHHGERIDSDQWAVVEYARDDDMLGDYAPQHEAPTATAWRRLDVGGLRAVMGDA